MLGYCWRIVSDGRPPLTQHWLNMYFVCCLLSQQTRGWLTIRDAGPTLVQSVIKALNTEGFSLIIYKK